MKNTLDIKTRYNRLEALNFIQRFATAYMHLESSADANGNIRNPDIFGYCAGCRPDCIKDDAGADAIRCKFFFLFNTMSGNSAIRCRFDGKPTEAQILVGDTDEDGHGCGSDFMIDFLFGYAGYDYRKCTDASAFKHEIIAAIDAGKPVIAKVKSGNPRFCLINGYEEDALICPGFTNMYWDFIKNGMEETGPDRPPAYGDLDVLYIYGDKTTRRYTLKDGLLNIRRTMECNIRENVLDDYITKLGGWEPFPSGDGFDKISPEERKARAIRLHETVVYIYNIVSFIGAFITDNNGNTPHSHYLHREIWALPAFAELSSRMNEQHWIILNAGHYINGFRNKDWLNINPSEMPGICTGMCEVIIKIKEADARLLELINQTIELLDKQ